MGKPTKSDRYVPAKYQGKLEPNYYCRHWNEKRQKYCRARAGHGTEHVGEGRCKWGGGASPIKSGRYSKIDRPRIRELYEEFAADPDPLNLEDDLHMARALLRDFLERYDEWAEAFLAWHESYGAEQENPKPRKVLDLADAVRIIDTISKVVERIEKIRSDSHISRKDLLRIIDAIAKILELRIQDDALKEQIRHDLVDLRLA